MTNVHEPVLHALSVEPRVARPGETVSVIFRTRNLGTAPSPAGTVAFIPGDGLEPVDATESAVPSVEPGDDVVAVMHARIVRPLDNGTELAVQAVLRVPDAVLGTNVCAVRVRSRAVLDGPASGTFVEPLGADHVRVRAVVTNEGDGAARDVCVVVAAPRGCMRVEGDGPAVTEVDRLDAGASVTVAFDARIVEPVAVVSADDGEVRRGATWRCLLPVREVLVLEPVIAAPCVAVQPSGRSVDVGVDVRNDGWVDARDVRVRVALPPPLRAVDGSIAVDGVPVAARTRRGSANTPFARVERAGGSHVVIAQVRARSTARIALSAAFPADCLGGTIVASAGAHEVAAPFSPERARDVRMRLIETPRFVAPSGEIAVAAEVVNAGDAAEELFFCIAGRGIVVAPEAVSRTVAPGSITVVEFAVRAHAAAPLDEPLALSVVACDAERERARADFAVVVRDRLQPCADDDDDLQEETLSAVVHAALHAPGEVSAGAPFAVRMDIDVEDPVDLLGIRVREVPGARYVCGSTSLDGRTLLDRAGSSPLAGDGLMLRSVPPGTRVTAAWTLLADPSACDEEMRVDAVLHVDGDERPCEAIAVRVRGRDAFAAQPAGLQYHVDACVIDAGSRPAASEARGEPSSVEVPAVAACIQDPRHESTQNEAPWVRSQRAPSSVDEASTFGLRLSDARLDDAARLMRTTGGGLVAHLLAARMLLPDTESSGDPRIASALDGVRCAVSDVFDRLFVKIRIPGFDVASDDLDDVVLRSAMIGLYERLLSESPGDERCDGVTVRMTRERVRELLAAFADAQYGAPAMLRALVALLPTHCECDPALGSALARYALALDDGLARYEGVPLEIFDDALARASDRALDDARTALAAVLADRAALSEAAC